MQSDSITVQLDGCEFVMTNDELVAVVEAVDEPITGPSFERALQDVREE